MPNERQSGLRERLVDHDLYRLFLKALGGERGSPRKASDYPEYADCGRAVNRVYGIFVVS